MSFVALSACLACDRATLDDSRCSAEGQTTPNFAQLAAQFGSDPPRGSGEQLNWFVAREPTGLHGFRYGVGAYGAIAAGDLDGDGLIDLVVGSDGIFASVFKNQGAFEFSDVTSQVGLNDLPGRSFALGDLDNDGDLDLLASTRLKTLVFENRRGRFTERTRIASPEAPANHLLLLDYDNDGLLDVFASHAPGLSLSDHTGPNHLYRNLGNMRFADVTEAMGIAPDGLSWAAAAFDFDHDGDQDIFVANDGGAIDFGKGPVVVNPQQLPMNALLENRGSHFVDRAADLGVEGPYSSMGAAVEDFDGDGQFEMFIPDFGANKLLKAETPGYREAAAQMGLTAGRRINDACDAQSDSQLCLLVSWGAAFEDFNQDGKRELLLLNHEQTSGAPQPVQLFEKQRGEFDERPLGLPNLPAHALITADFDHDGDLDWVASTVGEGLLVFENVAADHCQGNWLTVALKGLRSNREGVGSALEVTLEDGSIERRILGYGGMPHASLPAEVNFGLGAHTVKRLRVTWPTGDTTTVLSPKPRSRIIVDQE